MAFRQSCPVCSDFDRLQNAFIQAVYALRERGLYAAIAETCETAAGLACLFVGLDAIVGQVDEGDEQRAAELARVMFRRLRNARVHAGLNDPPPAGTTNPPPGWTDPAN